MSATSGSTEPQVTFIVPCYKLAHYLDECVGSILAQSFRALEVIIMDDCSPDDTPNVAQSLVSADPRVRYIRNPTNLGNIANYNEGFRHVRGDLVSTLSADDKLFNPRVVERYVARFRESPQVGIVHCQAILFHDGIPVSLPPQPKHGYSGRLVSSREFVRSAAKGCPCYAPTVMLRRSVMEAIGGFRSDLPRTADWHMWAAAGARSNAYFFDEPMIGYRYHDTNMERELRRKDARMFYDQELRALWCIWNDAQSQGHGELWPVFRQALAEHYAIRVARWNDERWPCGFSADDARRHAADCAARQDDAADVLGHMQAQFAELASRGYKRFGHECYAYGELKDSLAFFRRAWHARRTDYKALLLSVVVGMEHTIGLRVKYRLENSLRMLSGWVRKAAG